MIALQSHDTSSRSTRSDFGGQLIAQHVGAETAIMWHVHGTLLHRGTCTTVVPTVRVSNTHEAAPLAALHISYMIYVIKKRLDLHHHSRGDHIPAEQTAT